MSAEVIVTLAVGVPTALVAAGAYLASRSTDQRTQVRQLVTDMLASTDQRAQVRQVVADLLAPILVRLDNVEDDLKGHRHD